MKHLFITFLLIFLFTPQGVAQAKSNNFLKVSIVDVVSSSKLSDLSIVVLNESDSMIYQLDSIKNIELKTIGKYQISVFKEGYDTVNIEIENPKDSAELILEFYLPKLELSNKEKKQARRNSLNLPERPCDHCGGFQKLGPAYNEMTVARFRTFTKNRNGRESYVFNKMKYY